jgi:hypothetical protein
MKDINGGELREGGMAMLLCEVLAIDADGARVRVMNSELEILVGAKHDEVLGGIVADSELTAFDPNIPQPPQNAVRELNPGHTVAEGGCPGCKQPMAISGLHYKS